MSRTPGDWPLPDVLVLGAMRSGTTYLRGQLAGHPDILVPGEAEPHFFDMHWRGPPTPPAGSHRATGEHRRLLVDCTPYYLFHPYVPARVAATLSPQTRYIVLLREPGARAWSHYLHSLMLGAETLGFLAAIEAEPERLAADAARLARGEDRKGEPHQRLSYVARGRYAEQLRAWWDHVPREQFLLVSSAALFTDTAATLAQIHAFLGVRAVAPAPDVRRNATPAFAMPTQARAVLDGLFEAPNLALSKLTDGRFGETW